MKGQFISRFFCHFGLIAINLERPRRAVVQFVNKAGRDEAMIEGGKPAMNLPNRSSHLFRRNGVRAWMCVIAGTLPKVQPTDKSKGVASTQSASATNHVPVSAPWHPLFL